MHATFHNLLNNKNNNIVKALVRGNDGIHTHQKTNARIYRVAQKECNDFDPLFQRHS